jgi:hypothetical protein
MLLKACRNAWTIKQIEEGKDPGLHGKHKNRKNQHTKAAKVDGNEKVESLPSSKLSRFEKETAAATGLSGATIATDISIANTLEEAIGHELATEVSMTKLGTRDGVAAVRKVHEESGAEGVREFIAAHKDTGAPKKKPRTPKPKPDAEPRVTIMKGELFVSNLTAIDEAKVLADAISRLRAKTADEAWPEVRALIERVLA